MDEAAQILDGVLLSDGYLRRYNKRALFQLTQSGIEHMDWLFYVRDKCLVPLGIPISLGYPKDFRYTSKGKPYVHCMLSSKLSPSLLSDYYTWYPDGKKVVPPGLVLTTTVVAHWFMGDGCISSYGQVCFSTNAFSNTDRLFLVKALYDSFGITAGTTSVGEIRFAVAPQVDSFIETISPLLVNSFRYKVDGGTIKKKIDHIRAKLYRE